MNNYGNFYLFKRLLPYYKDYRKILILDLFFVLITVFCDIVYPILLSKTVDAVAKCEKIPIFTISTIAAIYISTSIMEIIGIKFSNSIGHIMGAKMETKMRDELFCHLQNLPIKYHENNKIGQMVSRLTTDLFEVTEFAHHFPEEVLSAAVRFVVLFIIMLNINLYLTCLTFLPMPLLILFVIKYNRKMKNQLKKNRNQIGELTNHIKDSLEGIRVVKSFANENLEEERFEKENLKTLKMKIKYYKIVGNFYGVDRIFYNLTFLMPLVGGLLSFFSKKMTPGQMTAYMFDTSLLLALIYKILKVTEKFQKGITGISRFVEIIDSKPTLIDSRDCLKLQNINGKIDFKNVWFKYSEKEKYVLKGINISIKPGEKIALVGCSGSGKTTICNVLERFYDLDKGEILLDEINIKNIALQSLHTLIGSVHQNIYLFTGSIKENICYGKPNATEEELINAAKNAGIHDFINSLPKKYDTLIGDYGTKLSGGQKQRISIARAFLKNPKILILDEATSSLDSENEKIIQNSLKKLTKGKTTVTIAHRLSTIKNSDKIFLIDDGRIIENGTHANLIKSSTIYKNLYENVYSI